MNRTQITNSNCTTNILLRNNHFGQVIKFLILIKARMELVYTRMYDDVFNLVC